MSLTHTDQNGHAHMVDVSAKTDSARVARASGRVRAAPATLALIRDNGLKKAMCWRWRVSPRSRRRRSAGS